MSARQILRTAYQLQLVPRDLYGQTQHKTLHARLATDILKRRSKSDFYRTGPGRFSLRVFLSESTLPNRTRHEYHAPLRTDQLGRFDVVAFPRASLAELAIKVRSPFPVSNLSGLPWRFVQLNKLRGGSKLVPLRFQLLLIASDKLFLDNRKHCGVDGDLVSRSVIGLEGFVKWGDRSLFSSDDFGLMDAATRALFERFELPPRVRPSLENLSRWSHPQTVIDEGTDSVETAPELIVYVSLQCTDMFELIETIDAQATAEWLPIPIKLNDLDRFGKWSSRLVTDSALLAKLCA